MAAIVFSSLSAVLWLAASAIRLPSRIWIQAGAGGGRPSPDVDRLVHGLRWQSRLNAAAAFCAALATGCQLVHL